MGMVPGVRNIRYGGDEIFLAVVTPAIKEYFPKQKH